MQCDHKKLQIYTFKTKSHPLHAKVFGDITKVVLIPSWVVTVFYVAYNPPPKLTN
jgi:hypothetical protein